MAKKKEVVSSVDDFEDLNLEDDFKAEMTEVNEEVDPNDEITLDIDEEESQTATESPQKSSSEIDLDDLDLDEEENQDAPIDEVEKEISGKEKKNPLDFEIDIDIETSGTVEEKKEEPKASKAKEEPKKAEKKSTKKASKAKEEPKTSKAIIFNPTFDLKGLDDSTYQIRKTERTDEELKDLVEKIKAQGQIEPIQVVIKEGKPYLLAGFGRVSALHKIGSPTAKALVYEDLDDAEITKICSGSNESRVELSEWDKICSVGEYFESHPEISKDDENDPSSLVSVFGYSSSSIYSYLTLYRFFKDKEKFQDLFCEHRLPLHIFLSTTKILKDYETLPVDFDQVATFVHELVDKNETSQKLFKTQFVAAMTNYIVELKSGNTNAANLGELENDLSDDKDVNKAEKEISKEIDDIDLDDEEEGEKEPPEDPIAEKRLTVAQIVDNMIQSVDLTITEIDSLLAIKDFKKFVQTKQIDSVVKKVGQIAKKVAELV
jgi:hypothetical protein